MELTTPGDGIRQLVSEGKIRNLTPHPIKFPAGFYCFIGEPEEAYLNPDSPIEQIQTNSQHVAGVEGGPNEWVTIHPTGKAYRLEESDQPQDWTKLTFGSVILDWMPEAPSGICAGLIERKLEPTDLPQYERGVWLIVSLPVLMALGAAGVQRSDLIAPDTGSTAIRDDKGQIKAVRGFVRLFYPVKR